MSLVVQDCSPFGSLSPDEVEWLRDLVTASADGRLVLRLEEGREDEPVVYCERDGTWWAGRYVGSITFKKRRLDIRPRFGEETLRAWFAGAFNLALAEMDGELSDHDWFVPWLLASVWSRSFVAAARHGLPALKAHVHEAGLTIKGRLDVPGTVRMRGARGQGAVSRRGVKTLDNPISAAIVAGYAELARWMCARPGIEWLPGRVKDLLPPLVGAVGGRPNVPTLAEINRVRLTPITAGFRPFAELSARIASRRGLMGSASDDGQCKGILLDVAELWELYVLAVLRRAWPDRDVVHGTRAAEALALLLNDAGAGLGVLKPDAVVERDGQSEIVVDAKYKRLWPSAWSHGPQREDMYQLAAYLGRYGATADVQISGVLAYPHDPWQSTAAPAEADGPWRLDALRHVWFIALPQDLDAAAKKIRAALSTKAAH